MSTDRENSFGRYIKQHRENLGLRQIEAAEALEISTGYLCDIEKGNRPAPLEKLNDFVRVFKIRDITKLYDLAAKTQTKTKNKIPKDIYEFIENNEILWPVIREMARNVQS